MPSSTSASHYRLSGTVVARVLGVSLAALGALVVVVTVLVTLLGMPSWVLGVTGVVVAAGVAGAAAFLVVASRRPPSVVTLDDTGYRVRMVRGTGESRARWTDVEDVVAATVAGERCVVIRLRDGRTTTVPVRLLREDADAFADEVRRRLNARHGYRRIT